MKRRIVKTWMVLGTDGSRSFNLAKVKRRAALEVEWEFSHWHCDKEASAITHRIINADEHSVSGESVMEIE